MVKISDFLQQWLVVAVAALQMLKTAKQAAATQYRPTARCSDAAVSIWLHAVEKKTRRETMSTKPKNSKTAHVTPM